MIMVAFSTLVLSLSTFAATLLASPALSHRADSIPLSRRSSAPDYTQNYVISNGNGKVTYTPSGSKFTADWNNMTAVGDDFVVGLGWNVGTTSPVTYGGAFQVTSGTGFLCLYGWTENPLVEYYVVEAGSGIPNPWGTEKGSVTSDGSKYSVHVNKRVNQDSIVGKATYDQYVSIRTTTRTSGTITVDNHFKAWAGLGLKLGTTMKYQVMAIEGWQGSGSTSQTVSN